MWQVSGTDMKWKKSLLREENAWVPSIIVTRGIFNALSVFWKRRSLPAHFHRPSDSRCFRLCNMSGRKQSRSKRSGDWLMMRHSSVKNRFCGGERSWIKMAQWSDHRSHFLCSFLYSQYPFGCSAPCRWNGSRWIFLWVRLCSAARSLLLWSLPAERRERDA